MATYTTLKLGKKPEDITLYGQSAENDDFISDIELHSHRRHYSVASSTPAHPKNGKREVTRSITLHYTAGWRAAGGAVGWDGTIP